MHDLSHITSNLQMHAAILDDIEQVRIATSHRIGTLARDKKIEPNNPFFDPFKLALQRLVDIENEEIKGLKKTLRRHPLGSWVSETVGIGEKQGARLIAVLGGDPAYNFQERRLRRGPAELWAYAGYHTINGQALARQSGHKSIWNPEVKRCAFLIAQSCIKHRHSPYRAVYDNERLKNADATHSVLCRRCGPSGSPALPGSALNDGHKHARALRAVSKSVLKDLYSESKALLHS